MAESHSPGWALGVAIASLGVSVAGAYFSWSRSPFFVASPEHLSYWYEESNELTEDKQPKKASLKVIVCNRSTRPAEDVLVKVTPLCPKPSITCSVNYEVLDGPKHSKLVTIKRIPPSGSAEVHVLEDVNVYPAKVSFMGGAKFRYSASVDDVQTGLGTVRCEFSRCTDAVERLPGDDEESFL